MKKQIQLLVILCLASNLTALDEDRERELAEIRHTFKEMRAEALQKTSKGLEKRQDPSQTVLHQMVNEFKDNSAQIAAIIQRLNKNEIGQLLTTKNSSGRIPLQEAEYCRIHHNTDCAKSLGHHTLEALEDQFRQQDKQKMLTLIKQIFNNESEDPCKTSCLRQYVTKAGNTAKIVACNIAHGAKKKITQKLKKAERFTEQHHAKIEQHIHALGQDFAGLNA